jgi:hypothetical protein
MYRMSFAVGKVRANLIWRRALELAADSRKAPPKQGARQPSTSLEGLVPPAGAGRDSTHAGRGSQPEERQGLAAEVHKIDRHRKNLVRTGFRLNMSIPNIF